MKRSVVLLFLIMVIISLSADIFEKCDPVFIAYFADSFGIEIETEITVFKSTMSPPKTDRGVVNFDNIITMYDDSLIEIIVETGSPMFADSLVNAIVYENGFITGTATFSRIVELCQYPDIEYIHLSKPLFQSNDKAQDYSNIDELYASGYYGEDVTACIIDNGIDSDAPVFGSRIKYIWNQIGSRTAPPPGFRRGEEIDSSLIPFYDINDTLGHGTAVLASMASSDTLYPGVLRLSDIIAVNAALTQRGLMDGIKYISDKCSAQGRSFVLCIPVNHYWGSHDGMSPAEQTIDHYFADNGRGRGVSVSSGNLGDRFLHFSTATESQRSDIPFENNYIGLYQYRDMDAYIDIIADTGFSFRILVPHKNDLIVSDWVSTDSLRAGFINTPGGRVKIGFNSTHNHLHIISRMQGTVFAIELNSEADSLDGYIAGGAFFFNDNNVNAIAPDNINSIASPGLARNAITAGSYLTRSQLNETIQSPDSIFTIFPWNGTSRQRYVKPDVYAPGKFIISYDPTGISSPYSVRGNYRGFTGSSFSAAVTAGAMGIILGTDPMMSTKKINRLIREGVKFLPYTGSASVGYGFLDAYNSFMATRVDISSSDINIFSNGKYIIIELDGNGGNVLQKGRLMTRFAHGKARDSLMPGPSVVPTIASI
ncbi:MAG: S8 family serine peptidase [candidate division WOR-3 bacterium]|nr:S8 family serine peptidase [candidate division WOR-3 bacterium]